MGKIVQLYERAFMAEERDDVVLPTVQCIAISDQERIMKVSKNAR